jgi:peroxiredoxin
MSKSKKRRSYQTVHTSGGAFTIAGKPINLTWLAIVGIVFAIAAALLVWRSLQSTTGAGTSAGTLSVPLSDAEGTQLGEIAPNFTVPTLDGGTFSLVDQRGKPTIIFFMAYWCGTCIPEARALAQLNREYGEQVSIVAIDVDPTSTPDALAGFKQATDSGDFTWAFDTGQQVTNAYQVRALDTTLVLDSAGHVVYSDAYPTAYQILKDTLTGLGL